MSESGRGGPLLSGLISPPAAELYSQLLLRRGVPIGTRPGEIDPHSAALGELLEAKVAFRTGDRDALVRPLLPAAALRTLLELRHGELDALQDRIREGWQRLEVQLPSTITGAAAAAAGEGVELVTNTARIATLVAELFHSPKSQFRGTETGHFPTRPTEKRVFIPSAAAIAAGVRYRYLYQVSYYNTEWGRQIVDESAAAGEQVRLRRSVPVKMVQIDLTAAVVAVDPAGQAALLVTAPSLLAMLAEWFDQIWDDPLTTTVDHSAAAGLRPDQLRVLRQLPTAESDAAIARSLRMSVTTVRRHVKAIYGALGVNTRFAAGAAAARRGWI